MGESDRKGVHRQRQRERNRCDHGAGWSASAASSAKIASSARLADEDWTGAFDLSRDGVTLGRLDLAHDGPSGAGGMGIDAPSIVFAEGGLQPADLSPLAGDFVGSPATGSARFDGRVDWAADGAGSSGGLLSIPSKGIERKITVKADHNG